MAERRLRLRHAACALALLGALLAGCGSAPPQEIPAPPQATPAPAAKAESEPPAEELRRIEEKKQLAEIDPATNIFFTLGSSTPAHSEKEKVREAAARLKEDDDLRVTLIGHADGNGSRSLNLAVADARVEWISATLRKLGVKAHQITKNVVGGEKNLLHCRSSECRRKMRRVELRFSKEN